MQVSDLITHARLVAKAEGKKHVMARPRRPRRPLAIELSYAQALLKRLSFLNKVLRQVLLPRLPMFTDKAGIRTDDWSDDLDRAFAIIRSTFYSAESPEDLDALVEKYGRETSTFQKKDLEDLLKTAIGVNVFFEDKKLLTQMKAYVSQNVELITSIEEGLLKDVKARVLGGVRAGVRVEEMRDMIEERYGVSKSRAMLIARDQTGKFYGELNRERQRSIGINRYTWRGVEDEREREMHRDLEGEEFEWGKPPVTNPAGDRNEPGGDYECRCTAEPVLHSFVPDYEEENIKGLA